MGQGSVDGLGERESGGCDTAVEGGEGVLYPRIGFDGGVSAVQSRQGLTEAPGGDILLNGLGCVQRQAFGLSPGGLIARNLFLFNESFGEGGALAVTGEFVNSAAPPGLLIEGTGSVTIDSNLMQGNSAGDDGGAMTIYGVNGLDVATNPDDPAYNWELYDRTVNYAAQHKIRILFSIYGTPGWANGEAGLNRKPKDAGDLRRFAFAAATRYSGTYPGADGRSLPAVRHWLAWNEPNNPVYLSPQYARKRGKWVIQSADDYAKICEAIHVGVHATLLKGQKVACGATGPRGNNSPTSPRPSVSPIAFLRGLHNAGLRGFDVYAHHPYYGSPAESPTTKPPGSRAPGSTAVTLGNINVLIAELTRLYGKRRLWITEYGYQTNPPDRAFGVSWTRQAAYLAQAFSVARRNPRIDMMLWFMLQDEPILGGWQSGLITASGLRKPAFEAFRRLR